jgi:mRNA degradation ribonuclease J1/J2
MMSDSTNVLTPGRTAGERIVQDSLGQKVLDHEGQGRVIVTQVGGQCDSYVAAMGLTGPGQHL